MIRKLIELIAHTSNWRFIIPFFLATAFLVFLFIDGQNEMSVIAGEEVTLIDLWKGYNLEDISSFFKRLKPEGRAIHLQLTSVNDMIFPFTYGPLLILIFAFLLKKIFGKNSSWLLLSLFPILTMGIDYLENFNTVEMLNNFPNLTEDLVNRGSVYTEMKHFTGIIRNTLFVLLGSVWLIKMLKKYWQ